MSASVRPVSSGWSWVWLKKPGTTFAPRRQVAVMVDGTPGEQVQEVALARAVRADDRDALAEPQLGVERIGEPVELEPFEHDGALARARATEPHR